MADSCSAAFRDSCSLSARAGAAEPRAVTNANPASSDLIIVPFKAPSIVNLLVSWRRGRQHFSGAVVSRRTDHTGSLHGIHQIGGPVVADFKFALHRRDRHPPVFCYEGNRLVKQGITFIATASFREGWNARQILALGTIKNVVYVFRLASGFPGTDYPMHFVIVHKGSVHPNRQAGARRQVKHVSMP